MKGLGYDTTDIAQLQENTDGIGYHHIRHMLDILKGEFTINTNSKSSEKNIVSLKPFAEFISGL